MHPQEVHKQLQSISSNVRLLAFVVPLARAASGSDNLSAVYARTFERAAFGFAKVQAIGGVLVDD